jgi:hypothetical protein
MAFWCVSQQGEFKKHQKSCWGKFHAKKPPAQEVEGGGGIIAFLAGLCMRSSKTPQKHFLKSDLKTQKISKK